MAYDAFISYSHAADGRLAPAVQTGLQRLARPWYRVRALRVFRDDTGLAVNPHLWASIATAMDESAYFVLLASPEAAASPWVNREIEYWCAHKSTDRILPVLTDGTLVWDATRGEYAPAFSSALPAALVGKFADEPRHLDLRWARDETELDLRHSRFREAIAELAAPMHGLPKEELESEDVRRHRRAMGLARGAAAALFFLLLATSVASAFALTNAHRANAQAAAAKTAAGLARRRAGEADAARRAETSAADRATQASSQAQAEADNAAHQRDLAQSERVQADQAAANALRAQGDATSEATRASQEAARADSARKAADAAATSAQKSADDAAHQRDLANAAAQVADVQKRAAQQQRLAGVARQLVLGSSSALKDGFVDRALLLGMEAGRFADRTGGIPGLDARQPLVDALQRDPSLVGYLQGLTGQIRAVTISPDGSRAAAVAEAPDVATGLSDQVGIWNLTDRRLLATLPTAFGPVSSVGFVDARTLVVGAQCEVDVYRDTGQGASWALTSTWAPQSSQPCTDFVTTTAVEPSGIVIAAVESVAPSGTTARAYVLNTKGVPVTSIGIGQGFAAHIAIARNATRFAIDDGPALHESPNTLGHVYSTTGALVATLRPTARATGGFESVTDLRFSADGSHLAMLVGGADLPVHRFDLATGIDDTSPPPSGSWSATVPSYPIAITPAFDRVVQRYSAQDPSNSSGSLIGVGYLGSGSFVGGLDAPLDTDVCHACEIVGGAVAFSPDATTFVMTGATNSIPVFVSPEHAHPPLPTSRTLGAEIASSESDSRALSPDRSFVAIVQVPGGDNSSTLFLEPLTPTRRRLLIPLPPDTPGANGGTAESVGFGESADVAAVGFSDGAVELLNTSMGTRLLHLGPPHPCDDSGFPFPSGGCHVSFAGTIDNGRVVEASHGYAHIWDISRGAVVGQHDIATGSDPPYGAWLASSGNRLVVFTLAPGAFPTTGTVHVYDAMPSGWMQQRTLAITEKAGVPSLSIEPDASRLAVSDGANLTTYDLNLGTTLWTETLPTSDYSASLEVKFSQDGQTLYALVDQYPLGVLSLISPDTGIVRSTTQTTGASFGLIGAFEVEHRVIVVANIGVAMDVVQTMTSDAPLSPITDLTAAGCNGAGRNLTSEEWTSFVGTADPYERTCTAFP